MSDERLLPMPSPSGWKWVIGTFLTLGVIGVTLSLIYRDYSEDNDPSVRERKRNAELVSYAVVFSKVPTDQIQPTINGIIQDIGPDSARTDLVIGSSVTDPWCRSIEDYRNSLTTAMTKAKPLPIGKQTLVTSMVAGLLVKSDMPATLYLIGSLEGEITPAIRRRTQETVDAMIVRRSTRGPLSIVSYMDTTNAANAEYVRFYIDSGLPFEQR